MRLEMEPKNQNPLEFVQELILTHSDRLKKELEILEEQISSDGKRLDILSKARQTVFDALQATEKLRVSITGDLDFDDEKEPTEKIESRMADRMRKARDGI